MKRIELNKLKLHELSNEELNTINGGGSAFEWLGRMVGYLNENMKEALKNGYEHAGLFY
jgi:bacteriocin-like protein